ncbi:G protein-coupled receptor gpr1 [Exophiala sideris]|nr:G protein-coupled receptor gpr1 [Exophiala sideris]KAK5028568.1 G protein-coupled receptor gpr1 [Exophiala sideris]KAK5178686.1 G protein-coupled receptor gpr1 [Eurotiomycetes sp. CCFEE 6388]
MSDLFYATRAVTAVHEDAVDLSAGGSYNASQQRAIHIGAVVCASFSLVAVLVTLRWFLIMRRSFRHHLVMALIISDASKAFWYFVFPIVTFATGPVESKSNFCQASGFLLTFSVEAADMSILIIALHSILYILRPNNAVGEGGLYPYRYWIYPILLIFPLLASSLVFIADSSPYTTAGTFCYLPKRPIWYRLALAWVPRYIIIAIILIMYIWIYVYVAIKFRGFENLGNSTSGSPQCSRRKSAFSPDAEDVEENPMDAVRSPSLRPQLPDPPTEQSLAESQKVQPWDHMNFITSKALNTPVGTPAEDYPPPMEHRGSEWSGDTRIPPGRSSVRASVAEPHTSKPSSATAGTPKQLEIPPNDLPQTGNNDQNDPLKKTRMAIRKQLRYLFVYPLVYIIVWTFPFVAQIQLYNEYYVRHPVYWLNIVQVCMLALQAGADSVVFSWTEKPWRKIDPNSKFTLPYLRNLLLGKNRANGPAITVQPAMSEPTSPKRMTHWWDAEARRRKDSVWLGAGTFGDTLTQMASRTRSRSPEKRRALHSRKQSADQARTNPFRRATAATLTPVTSYDSSYPTRFSTQSGRTAPESVPESSSPNSRG